MSGAHDDTLLAASQAINTRPCGKDAQRSEHTGQCKKRFIDQQPTTNKECISKPLSRAAFSFLGLAPDALHMHVIP
ncbi:hypothetical protein BZG19_14365 [Salinivibrio kushneri]|nr:hypothetical protein BZG19_14365 [Salinivibrio kushneri]